MSQSLVESLVSCGLMSDEEVQQVLDAVPESDGPLTEEAFARRLIAQGKLTEYQAAALRDGRTQDIVLGNYVVLEQLGEGGMGTVFKAMHRRMKRLVAIKLVPLENAKTAESIARFQREVETIARLIHPNIVTAFDADEGPVGPFLVMEYVEGSDLSEVIRRGGPLALYPAVDAILQAARGLEYAHAQGVIHRDIKPANLMRDTRGTIKITDLGLARFTDVLAVDAPKRMELTQDGSVFGTVDFMSPEQALNTRYADHRSDIYSLGCTFYFLLTAQHTFRGETIMEKLLAHREQPLPVLTEARPDVPESVVAVFRKMSAKRPAERYQTMGELVRALEECSVPQSSELHWLAPDGTATQPAAVTPPTSLQAGSSTTLVDLSVLVVEPSRLQAMVLNRQLQTLGIRRIQSFTDGPPALESMRKSQPDLVISSMHLPAMTGAELVEHMRSQDELRDVGFVLISSETDERLLEPVRQLGTVSILPKPFGADQLRRALRAGLDFISPQQASDQILAGLNVLIVDDSPAARRHVRRVLERLGCSSIAEAGNGKDAVAILDSQPCDMIVTDYHMPEMDGRALAAYIRRHPTLQSLPILMVTSETDVVQLAAAREAGVSEVCNKVFEPANVRNVLERILATR